MVTVGFTVLYSFAVMAQSDDGFSENFSSRCQRAQVNLRGPVRDRDIRTRVDRLQAYRYIEKRLDDFTKRLEKNNQPNAKELRTQVTQLNKDINTFAASYETYDGMRDSLSNMADCGTNQELFRTRLSDVRQSRSTVNQNVETIRTDLDSSIRNQLSDLVFALETNRSVGSGQ